MLRSKLINFKGFMAPVFTPFCGDGSVNFEAIERYAELLNSKGITAVLVNGTTGEGTLLTIEERKETTEKWSEVCKKLEMALMVQISGCSFIDVISLAKHASLLEVDGVLCLPELYFKPKNVETLVEYLKEVSDCCPSTPLYYYHIPKLTNVHLPIPRLMQLANDKIPTFMGIKFSASDLDQGIQCLEHGKVFLGSVTILCGALTLGFDCAIMTLVNIKPEMCLEIQKLMKLEKVSEARKIQNILSDFVEQTLKNGEEIF